MSVHQVPRESAADLVRWLSAIRARARVLLVTHRIAIVTAIFLAAAIAGAVLDYLARFPAPVRMVAWTFAVGALGIGIWRFVVPAVRLRPSLTTIALRVERLRPELKGLLAAAVDFESAEHTSASDTPTPELARALERVVLREAVGKWRASAGDAGLVKVAPAARGAAWFLLILALALAPAINSPALWSTGAQRILTPWSGAAWPKRTGVADVTATQVHALGSALPLRAALTKWSGPLASADVTVRYRLEGVEGAAGTERRELLTLQDTAVRAGTDNQEWPMFERLIEPAGTKVVYRFETEDDATPWMHVTLVEPPRVESATATITPPSYSSLLTAEVDLGTGLDERAVAPPMLAGSRIRLDIRFNKNATLADHATIASIVGDTAIVENESASGSNIQAELVLRNPARIPIRLIDTYGIESVEDPVFVLNAQIDGPPAAAITDPNADIRVIPTAVVDITGEGRDDVGLAWVAAAYAHMAPAGRQTGRPSNPGGAVEPAGGEVELGRETVGDEARTTLSIRRTIDLATLKVEPGDEIHVTAIAKDLFAADPVLGAEARRDDPVRSSARIIRIISPDDLIEEIREGLTEIRQAAIRIEGNQTQAKDNGASAGASSEVRRAQAEVADRLTRQIEALDRIEQRVDRNRLDDTALKELLDEASETATRARDAAEQAAAGLERSAAAAPKDQAAPVDEPTSRAQDQALEETRRLVELLDRGEDTWVVESRLRQMLDAQRMLQNQTEAVARNTAGRSREQLSPDQRAAVDQLAEDQNRLAEEFDRLVEEMSRREQALREADPTAAEGLQSAGQRARKEQTSETMKQAAEQARQNQMSNAGEQQQKAEQSMQGMLADLQSGAQKRDERLRRLLRDLAQSIDGLITDQEAQIEALQAAIAGTRNPDGLDAGMITLNRNTLSVADQAKTGGAEVAVVATLLENASEAQVQAITALREQPALLEKASNQENRSLIALREARKAAEKEQDRQAKKEIDEKKAKLRAEYRAMLEKQVAIRGQTQEFMGKPELDRRDRVRLRRLSDPQKEIRTSLQEMVAKMPELLEATVFEHAHKRLDDSVDRAATSLDAAQADRAAAREDVAIGILQGLVRALDESKPDDKKFDDGAGGGGGGGAQSGQGKNALVSAAQELALLRSIQTVVANETSLVDQEQSSEARREMLKDLAAQQRELADIAGGLLSKFNQQNPVDVLPKPEPPPHDEADPDKPAEDPAPDPAPPPPDPNDKKGGAP